MTTFKMLTERAKDLAALLKPKQRHAISEELMAQSCSIIDDLTGRLRPFLPPTTQDRKEAKAHPTASQIKVFTTSDRHKKKFFCIGYFRARLRTLPAREKSLISSSVPKTVEQLRDALILYYYRSGKIAGKDLLKDFQNELMGDYNNLPEVRKYESFKSLYRELMVLRDVNEVSSRLAIEFPDEADLLDFATTLRLKIPAQKRGKKAPATTVYHRLAEVIFQRGALAKLILD